VGHDREMGERVLILVMWNIFVQPGLGQLMLSDRACHAGAELDTVTCRDLSGMYIRRHAIGV